jgi:broad specificity phosphatase PhoE
MKRVYLVRHGHAIHENTYSMDPDLTSIGEKQARYLTSFFKDRKIDLIISSELKRAIFTARHIHEDLSKKMLIDKDLNEVHTVGDWSRFDESQAKFLTNLSLYYPDERGEIGESLRMVRQRVKRVWHKILEMDAENVVIVSHNGFLSILISYLFGVEEADSVPISIRHPNVSVSEIKIEDTRGKPNFPDYVYKVQYISNFSHIPEGLITY